MGLFDALFSRSDRRRVLDEMMRFDDHMLADIGLTRSDVQAMRSRRGRARVPRDHE